MPPFGVEDLVEMGFAFRGVRSAGYVVAPWREARTKWREIKFMYTASIHKKYLKLFYPLRLKLKFIKNLQDKVSQV